MQPGGVFMGGDYLTCLKKGVYCKNYVIIITVKTL
jgi:hypothetical protein